MANLAQTKEQEHQGHNGLRIWLSVFKNSWRGVQNFDRSQITALRAVRSTIGFILPLTLGVLTGHTVVGVSLAGGALSLGSVGLTYTNRVRIRAMFLACLGVALSAFVGSLASHNDWSTILAIGIWGFGAGLLTALGSTAMVIGLQSCIALIILSHFKLDPPHATIQAALMLGGALFQTLFALIPIPGLMVATERNALAAAYQALANYAAEPDNMQRASQLKNALLKANSTLTESNDHTHQGILFLNLLEMAERLRLTLLVLRRYRHDLQNETANAREIIQYMDQLLLATSNQLQGIARDLQLTVPFHRHSKQYLETKEALKKLRQLEKVSHKEKTLQLVLIYGHALREEMQKTRKLAHAWKYNHSQTSTNDIHSKANAQQHPWKVLHANLTLRSSAFRHALRLGLALVLTTALYRIPLLPIRNGYWLPLTVVVVLKPDFGATITRGLARLVGTLVGVVLITLLVALLAPSNPLLVLFSAFAAFFAFSILFANYALFSVFMTIEAIFLLAFVTPQPFSLTPYRALDTAIGGGLAWLIFLIWPTWEGEQVREKLAQRLEALRLYGFAVLQSYAYPATYDEPTLHRLRTEARLAHSNADASVERALQEPDPHHVDAELTQGLSGAEDRLGQSMLALEAYLQDTHSRTELPEMVDFSRDVNDALCLLTTAIRENLAVAPLPDLHKSLDRLKHACKASLAETGEQIERTLALTEARTITRTIDIVYSLLSQPTNT